ncbi:MAG: DUF3341 domain-containing protein [Phycisphaerales bacterium]|nr:DUF3341 domain-containing protein [Phycisphaerales bacterium]
MNKPRLYGYLAQYDSPRDILRAAEVIRDAGFRRWDCLTPFPVHGLDQAMGLKKTILPWLVLGGGVLGAAAACFLQWYVNSPHTESASLYVLSGYPLIISGKPHWSLPSNIPVIFELTILFASLASFFGAWALSCLPRLYHPLFKVARFRQVTDDKFFILLEVSDPKFDIHVSRELLISTHPAAIEEVKD